MAPSSFLQFFSLPSSFISEYFLFSKHFPDCHPPPTFPTINSRMSMHFCNARLTRKIITHLHTLFTSKMGKGFLHIHNKQFNTTHNKHIQLLGRHIWVSTARAHLHQLSKLSCHVWIMHINSEHFSNSPLQLPKIPPLLQAIYVSAAFQIVSLTNCIPKISSPYWIIAAAVISFHCTVGINTSCSPSVGGLDQNALTTNLSHLKPCQQLSAW